MSKISIIVPVYNVEDYIADCINSIKKQTFTDFECLLVDDGTKDNSVEVAIKAIDQDERFYIFHKENGGLSDARNYGLERIKGDYVCFVDSDDFIRNDMLEKTYTSAVNNNSDIVLFDLMYMYPDGTEKVSHGANGETVLYKKSKDVLYFNNSANNKLFRSSFLSGKRFIRGIWYEDLATVPVWMCEADIISYVNEPLYYYVQRQGSISHSANSKIFDIYLAIDNIKTQLHLSSQDVKKLYFNNCAVMTTLRIKEIDDQDMRISFFKENTENLNSKYSHWYKDIMKESGYNSKQKIIFTLMKMHCYRIIDRIYRR